jgi:hypothetical protein
VTRPRSRSRPLKRGPAPSFRGTIAAHRTGVFRSTPAPEATMIGRYAPPPDPDRDLVLSLALKVRELCGRPHRWAWDLRDSRDGSWFESMLEFDSAEQARRSGLSRLAELGRCADDTGPAVRGGGTETHHLVMVSRDDDELYSKPTDLFAGTESIDVIRRRSLAPTARRSVEHRSPETIALACGCRWSIACRSGHAPPGRVA